MSVLYFTAYIWTMIPEIQPESSNHSHAPLSPNRTRPPKFDNEQERKDIGDRLYKASIKCDWKVAEIFLNDHPNRRLVSYSLTKNGDTALHIAASVKGRKKVDDFVKKLVDKMDSNELEIVNNKNSTALYLAAAAGNLKSVDVMMEKNRELDTFASGRAYADMPLYAAALFGHKDVVSYLYERSKPDSDPVIGPQRRHLAEARGWDDDGRRDELLEKCVEGDMFDIAINIVGEYPELGRSSDLLGILARKPEAFHKKKSNIIRRIIKSISGLFTAGTLEEESDALRLLRILWQDIVKLPKKDVKRILRGPLLIDSRTGRIVQTLQLKQLVINHCKLMEETNLMEEANNIPNEGEKKAENLKEIVSKHIVKLHVDTQNLIKQENTPDEDQALELQKLISRYIVKMHNRTDNTILRVIDTDDNKCRRLLTAIEYLADELCEKTDVSGIHSSQVMFMAADVGNTNFLLELIRQSPDLIWEKDDNNQTIFHVAVTHRHEGIYNLLYEIGAMKDMVTHLKDYNGNNMLHLAAMRTKKKNLEDVSRAALQMQRELLWFKEVERMIPPYLRKWKNKDGFTPRALFTMQHQDLLEQGERWMKSTASQCMVVATLIATIVFAAAFTIPGGYNQIDGIPMFKRKRPFVAFVVADAVSLFLSSVSILTFLSILTSRHAQRDFVASLPMKLMFGLLTLFLSIGTMMITFSVSFFVLYHRARIWIPIFISLFAFIPSIVYVALQYHLLIDVFRSTFGAKYLFKSVRLVLFDPESDLTEIVYQP